MTPEQMQFLRQSMGDIRQIPTMVLPRLDIGTIEEPITNMIRTHHHLHCEDTETNPEYQEMNTNIMKSITLYHILEKFYCVATAKEQRFLQE